MFGLSRMKYKVGDEVNISSDDGAPDVVGVIANVRKTDQGVMYEVSVADGALDIQGGTILEIPEERVQGMTGYQDLPWYSKLGMFLGIRA